MRAGDRHGEENWPEVFVRPSIFQSPGFGAVFYFPSTINAAIRLHNEFMALPPSEFSGHSGRIPTCAVPLLRTGWIAEGRQGGSANHAILLDGEDCAHACRAKIIRV